MAKKKAAKSTSTANTTQSAKVEETVARNHKVLIGALIVGVVILLVLLFQGQTTINEQRTTISEQQQQINTLEAKIEDYENNPLKTILDSAGEQIIEKGTEILEEIISPN